MNIMDACLRKLQSPAQVLVLWMETADEGTAVAQRPLSE